MAGDGWVPPETPPPAVGWRRWLPALIGGIAAGVGIYAVLLRYIQLNDPDWNRNVGFFLATLLAIWIGGSVVTGLIGQARTLRAWVVAFALMAGVIVAGLVLLLGLVLALVVLLSG